MGPDKPTDKNRKILVAASYARTSTEQQQSCESQQGLCRRLIDERGWTLRFRLQDAGEKGQRADRPAFQRLLELAADKRIDVIVVWKLDRLFRSLKEASAAEEALRDSGVAIVSYTEPFDTTTPIGRFVFGFLANVAQFETELIRERAHLGYERRVKAGRWTGGHAPFGYALDPDGKLVVANQEAEVVRLLVRSYKRIGGDRALACWLNHRNLARRGRRWTTDQVRKALTNPLIAGTLMIRGESASHPHLAIITKRSFQNLCHARQAIQMRADPASDASRSEAIDRIFDAYIEGLDETA